MAERQAPARRASSTARRRSSSAVEEHAKRWSDFANITVEFGNDPDAEIRISFEQEGSWSYIGTVALAIDKSEPTMNFGWLEESTPDEEYERVVVHEFGHALFCIHEHQNPVTTIPWDKDAVYAYYMGPPNNWTKDQVDQNLFARYSTDITQYSAFDPKSIMLYPIPNELTIGDYEVGFNTHAVRYGQVVHRHRVPEGRARCGRARSGRARSGRVHRGAR